MTVQIGKQLASTEFVWAEEDGGETYCVLKMAVVGSQNANLESDLKTEGSAVQRRRRGWSHVTRDGTRIPPQRSVWIVRQGNQQNNHLISFWRVVWLLFYLCLDWAGSYSGLY